MSSVKLTRISHRNCTNSTIIFAFIDEYIWNRTHFITDDKWRNDPNSILVHGHTPIQIISKYVKVPLKRVAPIRYANNTKIDLDVATYDTNIIYLFDVNNDTFIPFYDL